jgi:exonuclease SbcD
MRVLHTSDWHLGKSLGGVRRLPEHQAFADEIVALCDDEQVDLVLLTGDVFDTYNPPIEAEELFFETLARLGDRGRRAVVVLAGNHDSPDRLTAAVPLAASHGVWIVGRPSDVARGQPRGEGRARLLDAGPSWLELATPSGDVARIAALPYPSEARFGASLTGGVGPHALQAAYSRRVGQLLAQAFDGAPDDRVCLAASHLAVRSCMPSESERVLVGGAYQVDGADLPVRAAYTALGHLHLPQEVSDAPGLARYAGSPLAFRMSERDNPRVHTLVDVAAGQAPVARLIPVTAGRALVAWRASSIDEVTAGVESGRYAGAIVELTLAAERRLTHADMAKLQKLPLTLLRVRVELPDAAPALAPSARHRLPPPELFRAFYRDTVGVEPDDATVDLFIELLGETSE